MVRPLLVCVQCLWNGKGPTFDCLVDGVGGERREDLTQLIPFVAASFGAIINVKLKFKEVPCLCPAAAAAGSRWW